MSGLRICWHKSTCWLELQHVFPSLHDTRSCHFWTISSQNMWNGFLTTMWYEKEAGYYQLNPIKLSRRLDFIQRRHVVHLVGLSRTPYYELLQMNETINSEMYCAQVNILKAAIEKKRPGLANRHRVVFY